MRPGTGQVGAQAPWGQSPGPKPGWPLLLLGLAVGAHGRLPPTTAAPPGSAPGPRAPGGSSSRSLWDRFLFWPGPHGAGPRCWPGGFWPETQSPWFVFSEGIELTVLGKWFSPCFSTCPTPLLSQESYFYLGAPSCLPSQP
uniref:Uncharacterized protein n=2 Tax=Canis lupus familiaris TaxID=9615 RepID=A0A8I3PNK2_CANLF